MKKDYLNYFKSGSTILETPRLILRRMSVRDRNDMYDYASRDEVTRYLLWRTHKTPEHTKRYLEYVVSLYRSGQFFDFAIEYRENSKMIGTCGFASIDENNRCAEVGYVISPDYKGKGIASEALSAMLRFGFCDIGLNRIEARYMTENAASRRVMEKCCMTFEGVYKQKLFVKDEYKDIGVCALLASDYFKVNEQKSAVTKLCGNFLGIKRIIK